MTALLDEVDQFDLCDHKWLTLQWYSICLYCYHTDVDVVSVFGTLTSEEFRERLKAADRPWIEITTRHPLFMQFMRLPVCPDCGNIVVEEPTKRADGSIATGFTCLGCSNRWWVEESR